MAAQAIPVDMELKKVIETFYTRWKKILCEFAEFGRVQWSCWRLRVKSRLRM